MSLIHKIENRHNQTSATGDTENSYTASMYAIEPELTGPLPRRIRMNQPIGAIVFVLFILLPWFVYISDHEIMTFGIIWTIVTSMIFMVIVLIILQDRSLLMHGRATVARISSKMEDSSGDSTTYNVVYTFHSDIRDTPIENTEAISDRREWGDLEIGQPVTVLYMPDNPSKCKLYSSVKVRFRVIR